MKLFAGMPGSGSSFRGRLYEEYVMEVTGVSLYFSCIPPEDVKDMAVKLARSAEEMNDEDLEELELTREEVRNLARWFKVAAENGFALHGSW